MLRQSARLAVLGARVAVAPRAVCVLPQVRAFAGPVTKADDKAVRPFRGASRSEPEMEYIPEPSMFYMICLFSAPVVINFWFLTKFV
eukprot:NODE_22692_length_698_cov_4.388792.p3 GENE.NODE_22692_length_698_cov_4.388792~~NODE_22692_length_698_cov_4.388792.p3  ORF type:complete len:87 (-),score=25.95 NODE_22692_length_698_cov_4.388792:346-606(-)